MISYSYKKEQIEDPTTGALVESTKKTIRIGESARLVNFDETELRPTSSGKSFVVLAGHLVFLNKEYEMIERNLGTESRKINGEIVSGLPRRAILVRREIDGVEKWTSVFDGWKISSKIGAVEQIDALSSDDIDAMCDD